MTKIATQSLEQQLRTLATRLRGEISGLRNEAFSAETGLSDMPSEQADLASLQSEEDRVRAFLGNEQLILKEVEDALERVEQGTYGQCTTCGKTIAHDRLESIPYTRFCVTCAQRAETARVS